MKRYTYHIKYQQLKRYRQSFARVEKIDEILEYSSHLQYLCKHGQELKRQLAEMAGIDGRQTVATERSRGFAVAGTACRKATKAESPVVRLKNYFKR